MPVIVGHSQRLLLRRGALADAPFVRKLVTQASWARYIAESGVESVDDAREYIRTRLLERYDQHGFGLWLAVRQSDDQLIGMAGLVQRDTLPGLDIGFALLDEHSGHGYALEAARIVLDVARQQFNLTELYAVVKPDNARSLSLLHRLGFADRRDQLGEDGEPLRILHRFLGESSATDLGS